METPAWTKSISSETVCTYYYVMFIIACIVVGIALFGLVGILMSKMPLMFKVGAVSNILVSGGLALVGAMFLYIMCTRALLEKKEKFTNGNVMY